MKHSSVDQEKGFSFCARFAALLVALNSTPLLACTVPPYGPEFDKHLVVEMVEESSLTFQVITPATIKGRNVESAWLAYYEKPFTGLDHPRMPVRYDEIILESEEAEFVGVFNLSNLQPELFVTVRVQLEGQCGGTASILVQPPQNE